MGIYDAFKPADIKVGKRYGRLKILGISHRDKGHMLHVECICDCGKKTTPNFSQVKSGHTQSCGCLGNEKRKEGATKHGFAGKNRGSLYGVWQNIIGRCENSKNPDYKNYGARGIKIHHAWRKDFVAFKDYVGDRPSVNHSLDRINNDGNYEPGNIRWATHREQAMNRRPRKVTCPSCGATVALWGGR